MMFMLLQTFGTKAVSLGGQVVLAWLLLREDFGLFAMAITVLGFATLVQQAGLREVLIHRQAKFERWATAAFWMSLVIGFVAMVIVLAMAPLAVRFYGEPQLLGMLVVLSISLPLKTLGIVPRAYLQSQMRFQALAITGWSRDTFEVLLTISFALLGFGVYSFVLPRPIVAACETAALWRIARPRVRRSLHLRRWKYLINDSMLSIVVAFLAMVMMQGDYIILGAMYPADIVGIYFFAYRISVQTIAMLNSNLAQVLLPALSHLQHDRERQIRGYLRGLRMLAIFTVPACFMTSAVADPLIRLVFQERWHEAIPIVQLLCVGMAFHAVTGNTGGLLMRAQGRFKTLAVLTLIRVGCFLVMVYAGATFWGPVGVAGAVTLFYMTIGQITFFFGIGGGLGSFRRMSEVLSSPLLCGAGAIGLAWWFSTAILPATTLGFGVEIVTIGALGGLGYALLAWRLMREPIEDIRGKLRGLRPGQKG